MLLGDESAPQRFRFGQFGRVGHDDPYRRRRVERARSLASGSSRASSVSPSPASSTSLNRIAATMAPKIGPMIQIQKSSQWPPMTAGPNQRAGFIAAPLMAPV